MIIMINNMIISVNNILAIKVVVIGSVTTAERAMFKKI
jgi:hypothetical protein